MWSSEAPRVKLILVAYQNNVFGSIGSEGVFVLEGRKYDRKA